MKRPIVSMITALAAGFAVGAFAAPKMMFMGADGVAETGKFIVRDEMGNGTNGALLGVPIPAEEKFVKAAASATVRMTEDQFIVTVDCPIPEGMKLTKDGKNAWAGDAIEVFLQQRPMGSDYFYYAVNCAGRIHTARYHNAVAVNGYNVLCTPTVTDFPGGIRYTLTMPLKKTFPKGVPKAGDQFAFQVCRTGPTACAAKVQSWTPVGTQFHDPTTFGRVYLGTSEGYAERERQLREQIAAKFAGQKLAVYVPADPWGNAIAPALDSQPLESLSLSACVNGRAYTAFALANLGELPFVGQIKPFGKGKWMPFNWERDKGLVRRVNVYSSVPVYTRAGSTVYDPVAPLAMKSLIRLAPGESALVWLELDAKGMKPDKKSVRLRIKSATPGVGNLEFPLELTVRNVDLAKVKAERTTYGGMSNGGGYSNRMRYCAEHGYNLVYAGQPGSAIWPTLDKDGNFNEGDWSQYDNLIEGQVSFGVPIERIGLFIYINWDSGYIPKYAQPFRSEQWKQAVSFFLRHFYAHLKEKYGITEDRVVLCPHDEPWGDLNDPKSSIVRAVVSGRFLREIGPNWRLMVDPLPYRPLPEWKAFMTELSKSYDVIQHYRPGLDAERIAFAKALPFKEHWTYDILERETPALTYRRHFMENLRDGFREVACYWDMNGMGGGDGFDPNDFERAGHYSDYGTVYADVDNDAFILSRRVFGTDLGYEDALLTLYARQLAKGDAKTEARIEELIGRAAGAGAMAEMDSVREKFVNFIESKTCK